MKNRSRKNKIVIVDDDEKSSDFLRLYLETRNYSVTMVADPGSAERAVDRERPDLIFLDYRMVPLTGKDILERLRVRGIATPVVMMSAYKRRDGDAEMISLGATAYISKPFDFDDLERVLTIVFG